jgi:hypothetical protein
MSQLFFKGKFFDQHTQSDVLIFEAPKALKDLIFQHKEYVERSSKVTLLELDEQAPL